MLVGKIASVVADKGFGFIKPAAGGSDVFFHKSALKGWIEKVEVGQECSFELDPKADKPRAQAVEVKGLAATGGKPAFKKSGGNDRSGSRANNRGTGARGADRRGNTDRRPSNRGADRSGRQGGAATQAGRSSLNRGDRNSRRSDLPDFEFGYVTRIHKRDKQGFISSDKHGPELVFDSVDVNGEVPFDRLKIGDYVSFIRCRKPVDPKDPTARPIALKVRYTERKIFHPRLHMARHPNARAKKPTWRS